MNQNSAADFGFYLLNYIQRTVIVAVIAVRMMKATVDQIVDMVAVRNLLMAAVRAVNMTIFVGGIVATSAGIAVGHWNRMLLDNSVFALVMKMTVMKVIDVAIVLDSGVSTIFTMLVIVVWMGLTCVSAH